MDNNFIIENYFVDGKEFFWAFDPVTTERKKGCTQEEAIFFLQNKIDFLVAQRKEDEQPLSDFEQEQLKLWLKDNFSMLKEKLKNDKIIFDNEFKELNLSVFVNHFDIIKEAFKNKNRKVEEFKMKIRGFYRYSFTYNYNRKYVDDLMSDHYFK